MNIEDLSKSQLLLLTVLVNFVTAIATAVLTVSLLAETPTTVVQTVNRIVDHTIETVTQVPATPDRPAAVPSTEELLVAAIAGNAARVASLYSDADHENYAGRAFYLPEHRAVVYLGDGPSRIFVAFANGAALEAERVQRSGELTRYGFPEGAELPQAAAAPLVALAEVRQGQTLISLSEDRRATTGIATKIENGLIYATLPGVPRGSEVVNLEGAVVGIAAGDGSVLPADAIESLIAEPPA